MIEKTFAWTLAVGTWATALTFGPPCLATAVAARVATAPYYRRSLHAR